ncbi:MAG: ATP-dependent 6-phosphofructokinase [Candidatus Alcyoniella australis]|nr:ATP-dependent 6-phosphofructokinase [Candidatus Alcyoniella australis]
MNPFEEEIDERQDQDNEEYSNEAQGEQDASSDFSPDGPRTKRRFRIKKIGVVSAGGDCPGINAVIRAVVKTAQYRYKWRVIGVRDGFEGLVRRPRIVELTYDNVSGLERRGGTILGTTNRGNPFAWKEEEDGKVVTVDYSKKVIGTLRRQDIDALVVIGGDGTMHIANEFDKIGVRLVGVPKTIDNDLPATDVTFGFDTAMNTAAEAIDKLQTTAESHHRVMVLETMGRYTGHIALHSGVASGADIILLPEIPFDYNEICRKIFERNRRGRRFSIICVAEGARAKNGEMVVREMVNDSCDPVRLGGIGSEVATRIHELTGLETRYTVLGHLQRGGTPTPHDRVLCTRLGMAAAHAVAERKWGRMVVIRGTKIRSVPIADAVGHLRKVDPESDLVQNSKLMGISFGD